MAEITAPYFAREAVQVTAPVVDQEQIATETYRLRLRAPRIARLIQPGQFVMLRIAGRNDPLIGRALALFDVHTDRAGFPTDIDVAYVVGGKFTSAAARLVPGQVLEAWGPLGNGFAPRDGEHLILVAGGIGFTPFWAVAQEACTRKSFGSRPAPRVNRVSYCYGALSADRLAWVEPFRRLGVEVRLATDDGSAGVRGLVTDALRPLLADPGDARILCCGPEPMMAAVAKLAAETGVPCEASLETPMACGVGICFSCVAPIRQTDGGWDYKRTCVEGPVFPADDVAWEAME